MDLPFASKLLRWYVSWRLRRRSVLEMEHVDLSQVRRVLLVLTTGIGDAVFSSAVFPPLRQALPEAEIRLFCRSAWRGLFSADPNLNGIIDYPGRFRRFFSTLRALREYQADLVLVLHGNDPDILPLCYLAGSRAILRIPTSGTFYPDLLSNRARAEDRSPVAGLHYVDNRLRILDTLGIEKGAAAPVIYADPVAIRKISALLQAQFGGRPYWVLHARAADSFKSLPDFLLRELIPAALANCPDMDLVLTGGKDDVDYLLALVPESFASRVFVAAGRFSLDETAACLVDTRIVVGPDTGVLHLAAALGRPVVGLFSPTRAALVGPRSIGVRPVVLEKSLTCDPCLQKRCPHRPVLCMSQFSAAEVLAALTQALEH